VCWSGSKQVRGSAVAVSVEGDGVDDEGVTNQVEVLSGVAETVGSPQVEGVIEVTVDTLGVVTSLVKADEIDGGRGSGRYRTWVSRGTAATCGLEPTKIQNPRDGRDPTSRLPCSSPCQVTGQGTGGPTFVIAKFDHFQQPLQ